MGGLTTVRLYGHLAARFGREFRFAISTPLDAIRALSQIPGFREALAGHTGGFRVLAGSTHVMEPMLDGPVSAGEVVRIIPTVQGAKDGWGQILTGVALIALAAWNPAFLALSPAWASAITGVGISMTLGGVSQLLATNPQAAITPSDPGGTPNYIFNGPVNTVAQGHCVPVCYGKMRVGSAVISVGTSPETFTRLGGSDGAGTVIGDGDATAWAISVDPPV